MHRSSLHTCLVFLWLCLVTFAAADVVTPLQDAGMIYDGKTSGIRYLSFLGDTENKLISTSFASLGRCPSLYKLGKPCVTFKLAREGQLDDMDHHPGKSCYSKSLCSQLTGSAGNSRWHPFLHLGATPRQRNFIGSPDLDDDDNSKEPGLCHPPADLPADAARLKPFLGI